MELQTIAELKTSREVLQARELDNPGRKKLRRVS